MNTPMPIDHCYRIDADDRIVQIDEKFRAFANENGTPDLGSDAMLGRDLYDFISGVETRHLYRMMFTDVRENGTSMTIPFRCDSPSLKRYMELTIAPAEDGGLNLTGRLLRVESRSPVRLLDPGIDRIPDLLTMCSFCKNVLLHDRQWVPVEHAVRELDLFATTRMPQLTHGVCDRCLPKFNRMCGLEA